MIKVQNIVSNICSIKLETPNKHQTRHQEDPPNEDINDTAD